MIHQLNPPIPVITPKGKAIAHAIIDYGMESDLQWVCFQDGTGECWTWRNPQVRAQLNITQGRDHISPFYNPEDVAFKKEGGYLCMECEGHNECTCDDEDEDEEEECDEECEEGPEEEGGSEDSYFLEFQREKTARILTEERLEEANQKIMKLEGTANTLCHTKRCIFELQDLLMRLIKYRKINLEEVENVINILRNTGIEKGDIDVICKGIIR